MCIWFFLKGGATRNITERLVHPPPGSSSIPQGGVGLFFKCYVFRWGLYCRQPGWLESKIGGNCSSFNLASRPFCVTLGKTGPANTCSLVQLFPSVKLSQTESLGFGGIEAGNDQLTFSYPLPPGTNDWLRPKTLSPGALPTLPLPKPQHPWGPTLLGLWFLKLPAEKYPGANGFTN